METMGKLRAQKNNRRHMMVISFMFYGMATGNNEALVNKISVLVNDMAVLRCYTNASIDIQWHFNSLINYVFAGGRLRYPFNERFLTEDDKAGSHILIIPKVKSEDAGVYYCQGELSGRQISSTHLTVLYSPPVCHSNMKSDGFVGPNTCCNLEQDHMVFNCTVSFNGNRPHLIWRSLNGSQSLNSSVCEDQPNRRSCSLILKSNQSYDGSFFICQTASSSDTSYNCSTELIKVQYFSATYDIADKKVNERVECTVQSNANIRYKWKLIQVSRQTDLSSDRTLLISEPGIYQCEVEYSIRNVSCVFLVSTVTASVVIKNVTVHYATTSGTTTIAVILSAVLVLAVFFAGIILIRWVRKHIKRRRIENERIQNKIEEMYKYFVLIVNPEDVLDLLIQKHIISNEDRDNVLNKETREDKCRALLYHVFSSSHRQAFIVLKKALSERYPWIVARIDAIDSDPVITIPENERIKDKVVSMYIDFMSEVDPGNVLDLLIQNRIVSMEEKRELMSKDTANERCRALIDILLVDSKENNTFIVLKEVLRECYPNIVQHIDASDADNEAEDITIAGKQENERIRNSVVVIYEDFVSEIDPKKVFDFLIQNKSLNVKQIHQLKNQVTTEDQCKALLDLLFSCSKDNVFIILKEALKEHYPGIVERIDSLTIDDECENNSDKRSTMRLESSIIVFGKDYNISFEEIGALKINLNLPYEVSVLQKLPFKDGINRQLMYTAATVYCSSVFVTGIGEDGAEIWRFDAKYSKWNKCASVIKGRRDHSVAFVDHILYICGGRGIYYGVYDDVEAYDAIDDKCSVVGKLTYAVCVAGNCVPYKASLYIFGGINKKGEIVNRVQVYNTKLNSCTVLRDPMPRPEDNLHAALLKNYFILLGRKSCFLYNFETETWEVRDKFRTDVYYFGMTVHNEKLFVIGGRDSEGNLRDNVRYVPIVNVLKDEPIEWKHHAKLPNHFEVNAFRKLEILVKKI